MGVAKVANNRNNLIKGSSTRQKLQNTKGYAESTEVSPALGRGYLLSGRRLSLKFKVN